MKTKLNLYEKVLLENTAINMMKVMDPFHKKSILGIKKNVDAIELFRDCY